MNSDHAPTAEEQLPPLDEFGCDWEDHAAARIRCYARNKGYCDGTAADALVTELGQCEHQLLAARRENREMKAERDEWRVRQQESFAFYEDEVKQEQRMARSLASAASARALNPGGQVIRTRLDDVDARDARVRTAIK